MAEVVPTGSRPVSSARGIETVNYAVAGSESCDPIKDFRAPRMMRRIAANKKDIDWAIAMAIFIHYRINCRKK